MTGSTSGSADCEYVIVGSGAGGGTLAARLAEEGRSVVLLEAGGDVKNLSQDADGAGRLPADYDVPVFHPFASENAAMKWDFFVRHYASDARQREDPKYREMWDGRRVDGVLYPRAGTLGGCTAHNAMIMVCPHNADWDEIARSTGDRTWRAGNMRRYFTRLEDCHHRRLWRWLGKIGINPSRHGWSGWLRTEKAIPPSALCDERLVEVMIESVRAAFEADGLPFKRLDWIVEGGADPNDWRLVKQNAEGFRYAPLTTCNHARTGTRERVLAVARKHPGRLRVELNALATRILFDEAHRAIGVEYLAGDRLYRAHPAPGGAPGTPRIIRASREVIVAGGAFNSPQLLMLSGIGPRAELQRHGIAVRIDLPGVGRNLQDRYEVSVVNRMNFDHWKVLAGARFAPDDALYREWAANRCGMYATNGAAMTMIRRSDPERPLPDIYLMALLGQFRGYFPGYAALLPEGLNYLSWTVLKAHTANRAGEVTLRSPDPRDTPAINFRYFDEGSDAGGEDLRAVVEAIKFVRVMTRPLKDRGLIAEEELPGEAARSEEQLADFVRHNAWGHHASCTCAIGARESNGVLSSDFRVHGTTGLRVVDASVFPKIPGFFIASAIYMIAEKAADVILADARQT
jgi:choline dehydrogenase-like flavoprotein